MITDGTSTKFWSQGGSNLAPLACQASAVPLGHGSLSGTNYTQRQKNCTNPFFDHKSNSTTFGNCFIKKALPSSLNCDMSNSPKNLFACVVTVVLKYPKIRDFLDILVHNYQMSLPFQIFNKFIQTLFRFQTNSV